MYTGFYNLDHSPFRLTPDSRFFFDSAPHKKALAYLTYGLNKGEGFVVMSGEIGTGKTTLIDHLLSNLSVSEDRIQVARIANTQLEATELLRVVASAFGAENDGEDKSDILRMIELKLLGNLSDGIASLLVVDEAQNLSPSALEELRLLSNFQKQGAPVLQIFLVGQPEFRDVLADTAMEQLRQRVIIYYHLFPLDEEDTQAYIEHRLHTAGWRDDPLFTARVLREIHEETGGVPRKINVLCDRLLLFGFLAKKHRIDSSDLKEVLYDLGTERISPETSERQGPELVFDRSRAAEINPLVKDPSELDRIIQSVHDLEMQIRKQKRNIEATASRFASI